MLRILPCSGDGRDWENGSGPGFVVQALSGVVGCQPTAGRAKIFVPAAGGDARRDQCSSVAQWQSIRLLTGGLLVRVQPEEPTLAGARVGTSGLSSGFEPLAHARRSRRESSPRSQIVQNQ